MHKILIALGLTLLTAGPLTAAENADVMAAIQGLVDAFNKGDTKAVLAASADEMCIIDEFPPYEWHGAGTCSKWLADYDVDSKKNGITDGKVTIGKPRHVNVTGDRAYVVVPTDYTFKQNGKSMREISSTWTFALQKVDGNWKVTGWAWAKH